MYFPFSFEGLDWELEELEDGAVIVLTGLDDVFGDIFGRSFGLR